MTIETKNLKEFIEIVEKLRSPQGCPWDREQTHKSLRENFIQEAYEAIDAIENEDVEELKEELGDVLLQVVLHSQIASETGQFTIEDVAKEISEKLIRRHPHVFGDVNVKDSEEVLKNWDEIKKQEKPHRQSALSGVTKSQPALMTALQLSKKAVKTGFEWPNSESLWECLESELQEFKDALKSKNVDEIEDEFGDIMFTMVNLARWYKVDPELALRRANRKFSLRFRKMEEIAAKDLNEYTFDELDNLWKQAKIEVGKL